MTLAPRLGLALGLACLLPAAPLYAGDEPLRSTPAPADTDAVADLVKALQDDNALVRKRAAIALGRLGPGARDAIPALEKAVRDPDADVRAAATAALARVDTRPSLKTLVSRLHDRKTPEQVRRDACKELAERFASEPAATRALEAVLTDPAVKVDAARALEDIDRRLTQPPPQAPRREGHTVLVKGLPNLLLRRPGGEGAWQRVRPEKGTVVEGDALLALPGYRSQVDFPGGVGLLLWGNVPEFVDVPLLESAVLLHPAPAGTDLDFTLERGRVLVSSQKKTGPARVRVHFGGAPPPNVEEVWELTLAPGAEVALDRLGRYPRDVGFQPKGGDPPRAELYLAVLHGEAAVKSDTTIYELRAPPAGPSLISWDNYGGGVHPPAQADERELRFWDKALPQTQAAQDAQLTLALVLKQPADRPIPVVLEELLQSDRPATRSLAVLGLGALDEMPKVLDALADDDEGHEEVRQAAVQELRHWIGERPGQDPKLVAMLTEQKRYTPNQAETVLQLLHDLPADQLRQPQTWAALIGYLRADRAAIRTLAYWHLYRLVPQGREAKYNPVGDTKQREAAYEAWKKLIPDGKLPPVPPKQPAPSK
jgi:HEAT repeat protein